MRRRSPASPVIEPQATGERGRPPALPPELEARIAVLEDTAARVDFDARSWGWMILFGVAIPLVLLVIGWCI